MNESEYLSVCAACDRVLLSPSSTTERMAIPWLHVIREHPVLLKTYVGIASRRPASQRIRERGERLLRLGVSWLRDAVRARRADGRPWFGSAPPPDKIDVLFVSHLLNESGVAQENDFFFGSIPAQLAREGRSVLVALINHCGASAESLAGTWHPHSVPRIVFSVSLDTSAEAEIFRRMWRESVRLRKLARAEREPVVRRVLEHAGDEALSSAPRTALRLSEQIRALVSAHRPGAIVVTHEGHAWERLTFAAARSVTPGIQCIGYQHSALFRLQHAVRRHLLPAYDPDYVLTSGAVSKMQLEAARSLRDTPIEVLGSDRGFTGGNRNGAQETSSSAHSKTCLVLPEGILSECELLFEFTRQCAEARSDVQFIWRLHPSVTFRELERANRKFANLPANIVKSQASLQDDLARSAWALYRGTTAVVQAVGARLRPVYLQLPGEMTIDPLYELDSWKVSVTTPAELLRLVDAGLRHEGEASAEAEAVAREYCARVFLPFDARVLTDILAESRTT